MSVIIANRTGEVDSAYHTLVQHIKSPVPIVMVSYSDNFVFNEELLTLKPKEFLVIDFIEMGWDYDWSKHSLESYHKRFKGEEWKKYHDWAYGSEPLLCFKRELDIPTSKVAGYYPIEYPAMVQPKEVQAEEYFNKRPINGCYYFGRSHESRLLLHASIWGGATKYGYSVCDNPYQMFGNPKENLGNFLENEKGKKYVSMHLPHWFRLPIELILGINEFSKISIAPHGAGIKTFRAAEISSNSVMLMWEDNLKWTYDWIHGFNCLKCKPGEEVETIEKWVNDKNLYSIYVEGVKTWEKYRPENYITNYIEPIINAAVA